MRNCSLEKSTAILIVIMLLFYAITFAQHKPSTPPAIPTFLKIETVEASSGGEVTAAITLQYTKEEVSGLNFTLKFDSSLLTIINTSKGSAASALTLMGQDIPAANESGELAISLVDFSFSHPIEIGDSLEVFLITFFVSDNATGNIPLRLKSVSASDPSAASIYIEPWAGEIIVDPPLYSMKDTMWIKVSEARPGDTLSISVEVAINSENIGGIVNRLEYIPDSFETAGDNWYSWGAGFRRSVDREFRSGLSGGYVNNEYLEASVTGFDFDELVENGKLNKKRGTLITYKFRIPDDTSPEEYIYYAESEYNILTPVQEGDDLAMVVIKEPLTIIAGDNPSQTSNISNDFNFLEGLTLDSLDGWAIEDGMAVQKAPRRGNARLVQVPYDSR